MYVVCIPGSTLLLEGIPLSQFDQFRGSKEGSVFVSRHGIKVDLKKDEALFVPWGTLAMPLTVIRGEVKAKAVCHVMVLPVLDMPLTKKVPSELPHKITTFTSEHMELAAVRSEGWAKLKQFYHPWLVAAHT